MEVLSVLSYDRDQMLDDISYV